MKTILLFSLIWISACNKTEKVVETNNEEAQCQEYKSNVLEAAVTDIENGDDVTFQFKSDEKEATALLNAFTHKYDQSKIHIEVLQDLAKECSLEKIKKWEETSLKNSCDYVFSEYKFFKGLIGELKNNSKWSESTKSLALNKTLENIRYYADKPSTMLQLVIAFELYKDLVQNGLIAKDRIVKVIEFDQQLQKQVEELQQMHKKALASPVSCQNSVYFKEFAMADEYRGKFQNLLK